MKESTAIFILVVLYLVGIAGILFQVHPSFILLTPINLLLSLSLVLYFHPNWEKGISFYLLLAFVVGFGIEIVGVNTGLVFGEYHYGPVLGWKLWDTPLMIGVNWIMLTYCTGMTVNHFFDQAHLLVKALVGAATMTFLDWWIEPVAMAYDFWDWTGDLVPLQNYIAWFVISFALLAVFHKIVGKSTNKVANVLLIMQFVFFIILNLTT